MIGLSRREPNNFGIGAFGVLLAAGSLIALSGCSSAPPEEKPEEGWLTQSEYQAEYQDTVAQFPELLPDGFEFRDEAVPMEGDIESSLGAADAYFQWSCAWSEVLLEDPNGELRTVAIDELRKFPNTAWGVSNFQDPDNVWGKLLDSAELGDLSPLKETHETDCVDASE